MPEQFDSVYRVVGFGDNAKRMALYDVPRDDTVWVNTVGYDGEINNTLENIDSGNVVEAVVTDEGNENEYWNLLDIEIIEDTLQYYVPTDGYAPGPVDEFWDQRTDGATTVTAGRSDDDDEEILYEIQVQQKEIHDEETDEFLDVYEEMQRGELLTEPMFEGSGCDYLGEGAEVILVVKPEGKEFIVLYLFPEKNEKFNDIWGALYDYVYND